MNPATAGGAPYRVPPEPSRWSAILLAAVVHAGLLGFLWFGIHWQNTQPVEVEAEVWDLKTQQAAPPAPEPTPAPPVEEAKPAPQPEKLVEAKPDIALEREKQRQEELKKQQEAEEKKAAAEKAKAEKLAKARKAAEEKALAKARDAEMARIMAGAGTAGTAAKSTAPRMDAGYVAAITAKIKSNIVYGGSTEGNPTAVYRIEQLPTGEVIAVKKVKSSGIPAYDTAVENAIAKSSPLPKKKDGTVERSIEAIFDLK